MISDFNPQQFALLNWFIFGLGCSITILRLGVRYFKEKRLLWDDYWVISALFFLFLMALFNHLLSDGLYISIALFEGNEPDDPEVLAEMLKVVLKSLKYQLCYNVFFPVSLWSVKASLMMFYRRLMRSVNSYVVWWWAVVGFCIVAFLTYVLTNTLYCRQFSVNPKDSCPIKPGRYTLIVTTGIDIISDFLIMILPIGLLVGLRIPRIQKIGVGSIFGLGLVVIIFSIIRFVEVYRAFTIGSPKALVSLCMWSMLEGGTAVIVGNLPALKPLISRRSQGTGYSSGRAYSEGGGTRRKGQTLSKSRPDGPIPFRDMQPQVFNSIRAETGRESSEALHKTGSQINENSISVAYEVSVSSHDATEDATPRS